MSDRVMLEPDRVSWSITPLSPQAKSRAWRMLAEFLRPSADVEDSVVTFEGDKPLEKIERHTLGEYFESITWRVNDFSSKSEYWLVFDRRPCAGRFWKDAMLSVIRLLRKEELEVSPISIERKVRPEEAQLILRYFPSTQDEIRPKDVSWFHRLGRNSRRFWRLAAKHSLNHETFTVRELARHSGVRVEQLKAGHRNSYRALRSIVSTDPLRTVEIRYGGEHVYVVDQVIRDMILSLPP